MKKEKMTSAARAVETIAAENTVAVNDAPATVSAYQDKTYYMVNPLGAIHECDRAHAKERLGQVGWRQASEAEIAAYHEAGGHQRFDRPLAAPFTPEPDPDSEIGD